jgi:predicted neuraminidase
MTLPLPPPLTLLPGPPGVNHGAGLVALGNGDLLACWYSGRSEAGPDVVVLCSRGAQDGSRWSAPWTVSPPHERAAGAPRPAKSAGNVALARDAAGRLVMIVGEIQSRRWAGVETCPTWRCGRIDFRISTDDGASWSAPTRLDDRGGALPRGRPIPVAALGDLVPVYQERGRSGVLRLDLGRLAAGAQPEATAMASAADRPLIQPSLVAGPEGVFAYLRDPRRRFVFVAQLEADGWSKAQATDLENPGSAVEAFRDGRGRTVLIHNPGRTDRKALSLAFSLDGVRFREGCDLVTRGAAGDAAYPSVTGVGPGQWGVAFSIEGKRRIAYIRLDQGFLDACAS